MIVFWFLTVVFYFNLIVTHYLLTATSIKAIVCKRSIGNWIIAFKLKRISFVVFFEQSMLLLYNWTPTRNLNNLYCMTDILILHFSICTFSSAYVSTMLLMIYLCVAIVILKFKKCVVTTSFHVRNITFETTRLLSASWKQFIAFLIVSNLHASYVKHDKLLSLQ
jgi:hypothetical protein